MPVVTTPTDIALRAGSREGLAASAQWFLRSGIMEPSGGVARYYLIDEGRNARISTEITGYAVSSLLDLHERTGLQEALAGAIRAGDFLSQQAWRPEAGVMPFEWAGDGALPEDHTYFFDCGIIARGLLRLWRKTGEVRYFDVARGCCESMRRHFENGRDIDPILELPSLRPAPRDARWSRTPDCYQLKSALAWLEMADATGDTAWRAHYERCLERSLATEEAFLTREPGVRVMDRLHSYGYFLEALLPMTGMPEVRKALEAGIRRAEQHLRAVRQEFERSDANAQLLRVRLFSESLGVVALDSARAAEEAEWSARYQADAGEARVAGGYYFGQRNGRLAPYANPVSTAFCSQAAAMWYERCGGEVKFDWRTLV